mmetsp:Transcript_3661/g.7385  ORF Transcript_3661/g.7385 Transcript_3661/m.7385 type:complete len:176 (-) Transcript_3661:68-595(-)
MAGVGNFLQQHLLQANNGHQPIQPMAMHNFGMPMHGHTRDASPHQLQLEQQQLFRTGKSQGGNNGGVMLPYPKTTVKLTAVNFESFAGFQPSVAGGSGNGNNTGFSAQPPASGGNGGGGGGRLVWSSNESSGGAGSGGNARSNSYATSNMGARSRSLRDRSGGAGSNAQRKSSFF